MLCLIQYIQNINISTCNQYKNEVFCNLVFTLRFQNPMCILHLEHILIRSSHVWLMALISNSVV